MSRRGRALRRRYGHSRVLVHNLDELYDAINGKRVTYDGVQWEINASMSKGPSSHQPYSRIRLEPTAAGKKSAKYQQAKREAGDDFSRDVTMSDEFWEKVIPKLVDDSGIGR